MTLVSSTTSVNLDNQTSSNFDKSNITLDFPGSYIDLKMPKIVLSLDSKNDSDCKKRVLKML